MRVILQTGHGGPEVLRLEERSDPTAGPGQVLVDVVAAGVNFADVQARVGLYPDAPKPPCVLGYEVAGTIAALGDGVSDLKVGDRVMAGTRFGGYAERVAIPVADVIAVPEALDLRSAAAIPVNYATAWAALMTYANLQAGERVLIHAAAGGVGIAATQIARRAGAEIHGTASAHKHDAIRDQGIDVAHDYRSDGWDRGLPAFDVILDARGGSGLRRSYAMLRPGGRLVAFGASSVVSGEKRNLVKAAPQALRMARGFSLIDQMGESKSVIGLNLLRLWDDRGTLEPWITPLQAMLADGSLRPVVHEAVPFDRAPDAHRILGERRNVGKVVLTSG